MCTTRSFDCPRRPHGRRSWGRKTSSGAPRITLVTSERIDGALRDAGLKRLQTIAVGAPRFQRFVYLTHGYQLSSSGAVAGWGREEERRVRAIRFLGLRFIE